ncbi:MAG: YfhO family protein [Clostridium sp.]
MKKFLKDIGIAFLIAIITFYLIYMINGSVLQGDLYHQGLDFLEYYKNEFNIFSKDWVYNWSIALGDNNFALIIYYLLSPFNLILKFMRSFEMVDILPIFLTFKITFMIYFASLFFEKVVGKKYRWIGALIYISNYNIMMYGNYQIMWMDTFIFLPLVLFGVEKILNKEKCGIYILALFLFVITDYYLAALIIPHIAIYGIIRYIICNNKEGVFKFIGSMVLISIVALLLAGFVLIPAIDITLSSAKSINVLPQFTTSLKRVFTLFTNNYIGSILLNSNSYITILGMVVTILAILNRKIGKGRIYGIHIAILFLAVFSDKINYILNFNYIPAGGNYRYNLFLNIYIGIIVCTYLKRIIEKEVWRKKQYKNGVIIIGAVMGFVLFGINKCSILFKLINIIFISMYAILLISKSLGKTMKVNLLASVLVLEVMFNCYFIYQDTSLYGAEERNNYSGVLQYIEDTYGKDNRVELVENRSLNLYTSKNVMGVSSYHSLVNSSYKEIGEVFTNTNNSDVRNNIKGRNIISQFTGVDYYVSYYNYCPYVNSKLVDRLDGFYIYKLDNNELRYFDENSLRYEKLPEGLVEKDALLYNNLYVSGNKESDLYEKKLDESLDTIIKEQPIKNNKFLIEDSGEYYIKIPKSEYDLNQSILISTNGSDYRAIESIHNFQEEKETYYLFYIGYLNKEDIIEFKDYIYSHGMFIIIDGDYINESVNNMNSIDVNSVNRTNDSINSEFNLSKEGYVVFPIVHDKNWKITSDDNVIEPYIVNGGFITLKLDAGYHNVEMKYINYSLIVGIACSIITLSVIIGIYLRKKFNGNLG